MFIVAKTLQALGMGLLLVALVNGLQSGKTLVELQVLVAGVLVFVAGSGLLSRLEKAEKQKRNKK